MRFRKFIACAALVTVFASCEAYGAVTKEITPTNGEDAGYTFANDAESANTGISVITNVEYDENTGEILNTTTKYVNINGTKYRQEGDVFGDIQYSWDSENNRLIIAPVDLGERPITEYNGNYIGNTNSTAGGAIFNDEENTIESIVGNFIQNSTNRTGGAIANSGEIDSIVGNFIGNTSKRWGGAIYNDGLITSIVGDFISNTSTNAYAGAIYNSNIIGSIQGDFIYNSASGSAGAIFNDTGIIPDINGNFINNTANGVGGAIQNQGDIYNITGNFIGNSGTNGGAIYNDYFTIIDEDENEVDLPGYIKNIEANFIQNSANNGSAIYNINGSVIRDIKGDFIQNTATANGTIYNDSSTIDSISGNFVGNTAQYGTAIYNTEGEIGSIEGNFIGNKTNLDIEAAASSVIGYELDKGGAIVNYQGTIDSINGKFIQNNGLAGGGINNSSDGTINSISGSFIQNESVEGGAIYNGGIIEAIKADFSGNKSQFGGAICNDGTISSIEGNFANNSAVVNTGSGIDESFGGAIDNYGTINVIKGNFTENNADYGGAIANNDGVTISSLSGSFLNNSANIKGGAIYNAGTINIVAEDSNTVFSGNTANGVSNAIYQDGGYNLVNATVNLSANDDKSIIFNDKITGNDSGYNYLNINNSKKGKVIFNETVSNQNINLNSGILHLGADNLIDHNTVNFNGGIFSTANGQIGMTHFDNFTITADTSYHPDVDFVNNTMDKITAENYGEHTGSLIVDGFNVISDLEAQNTTINFSEDSLKDSVILKTDSAYSSLYRYGVGYNSGNFSFQRLNWNPAVLASSIAATTGGYLTQLQNYNEAFNNMDSYMNMNSRERIAYKLANRYASAETPMVYSPTFYQLRNSGAWVRPYTSFESVGLKNGPKVDNILYGIYVGADTPMYSLNRDFEVQYSGYVGYNGSHQSYTDVGVYQHGVTLGGTASLYRNNFFTALTANVGGNVSEADTMFGHEDFYSISAGVASKTGYNLELADGKFIIQPSFLISYSFANTLDYKNAAGVRVESDPSHYLNIAPGIKFIGNLKNGWQPYIGARMIWNVLDINDVKVNNVTLPSMCIKPYVQYGFGLQKLWGERSTGFVQFMLRNGGRNGIAFNVGYRRALGK